MTLRLFWYSALVMFLSPIGSFADHLRGVVTDERGQPLAGVRIDIATAAPKVGRSSFCPSCYLDCKKWTRSNEQGEFVIEGLDPKLKFRILSTAPDKQTKITDLIDPAKDTARLVLTDFPEDTPEAQIIEGTVVSTEGVAIPGALVEPYGAKTSSRRWWGPVEAQATVSDDKGHFRMLLTGKDLEGVDLTVTADGYAGTRSVLLKPGRDQHRIQVPEGTSVTGRLVYKGKPQPGQRIAVVQTNRNAEIHFIRSVLAITDTEGRFEFHHLPANQQYAIFSPVGEPDPQQVTPPAKILTTKKFQCRSDHETRDLGDLELSDPCMVSGKVEMSDESALPEGLKILLSREPAWDLIEMLVGQDGRFQMAGLPPESYEFLIYSQGIRIDSSRLNYQFLRPNSFAMRLSATREGILIPLLRDEPDQPRKVTTTPDKAQAATDDPAEIAVKNAEFTGGGAPVAITFTDEPVAPDGPKLSVRGTVITAKGEPIVGATVIVRASIGGQFFDNGVRNNRDILAQSKSNLDGRFLLNSVPIPSRLANVISTLISERGGAQLLCYADGYGLSVVELMTLNNRDSLRVVLTPEADIRGIVRDERGEAIPGARIEIVGITAPTPGIDHVLQGPGDLNLHLSQFDRTYMTDDSGKFTINHMPKNRRLIAAVSADGRETKLAAIETTVPRDGTPKRTEALMLRDRVPILYSPVEIQLDPGRTLNVRVVDHDGTPVVDGSVQFGFQGKDQTYQFELREISTKTGTATFSSHAAGTGHITYAGDSSHPRVQTTMSVNDLETRNGQTIELRLPQSRTITGRVLNAATNEPVVGVMVCSTSAREEPFVSSFAVSGIDGTFKIPAALGENRIFVAGTQYGFLPGNGVQPQRTVVRVEANNKIEEVTLKLSPGLIIEGTVVDDQGKPVANALVHAQQNQQQFLSGYGRSNFEGKYRISGLSPEHPTLLTVSTGATADRVTLEGVALKEKESFRRVTVNLELSAGVQLAGRVMKNGKPQPGVVMDLSRSLPDQRNIYVPFAKVITDADGRYVVGGLDPGDQYSFTIVTRDRSTAPGWHHQSPYIQSVPDNAIGVIELPDAVLVGSNQSLAGVVVDPDGQPVSGIRVSASLKSGGSLGRRDNLPPPWTETDKEGQFQLRDLPDDELSLMAYKRNPAGGRIFYPVQMAPEPNQLDIRIILDPRLHEGVEDLDKDKPLPKNGQK